MADRYIRVGLWTDRIPDHLPEALLEKGVEVACLFQGSHEEIPSYPLLELFDLSALGHTSYKPWACPISAETLLEYYDGIFRISRIPRVDRLETLRISPLQYDEARELAYLHASMLQSLLEKHEVEVLCFHVLPHLGLDTLASAVAQKLNIPTLGLRQVRVPGRFAAYDLGRSGQPRIPAPRGRAHTEGAVAPSVVSTGRGRKTTREKISALGFYSSSLFTGRQSELFERLHEAFSRRNWNLPLFLLDLLDRETRPVARLRYRRARLLKRKWALPVVGREENLPENYVFFPLHLEPEANISAYGGDFRNQMLAIECIHSKLPSGWKLILKENPKQRSAWRSGYFFERLQALENVVVSELPSSRLIADSRIVATICGSAGYEAVLGAVPCVCFGDAWYEGIHGVFQYSEDLDLEEIGRFRIDRSQLDASANEVVSRFFPGVVFSRDFSLYETADPEAMAPVTADSMKYLISRVITDAHSAG